MYGPRGRGLTPGGRLAAAAAAAGGGARSTRAALGTSEEREEDDDSDGGGGECESVGRTNGSRCTTRELKGPQDKRPRNDGVEEGAFLLDDDDDDDETLR